MNYKAIYKPNGNESVVADTMTAIDSTILEKAFMIVATDKVEEPTEPYIAIAIKENQVLIGTKDGMTRIEASTIKEALGGNVSTVSTNEPIINKYTITFIDNDKLADKMPQNIEVTEKTTFKLSDITVTPESTDEMFEFNGWTLNGKPFTQVTIDDNIELVASWKEIQIDETNNNEE